MSLVGTYVLCNNGKWYANPVWYGTVDDKWWFICFDDDDPPEIVIARTYDADVANQILTSLGTKFKLIRTGRGCSRHFPHNQQKASKPAGSWFFNWEEKPDPPQYPSDALLIKPQVEGVYYDFVHH